MSPPPCLATRQRLCACLLLYALFASPSMAIVPPYVTDEELAVSPVIVVGRWNETPIKVHSGTTYDWVSDKTLTGAETRTELLVERVVKGKISPGVHPLLLADLIGWQNGPVMSYTSCEMVGDVQDVCVSNLWFLVPSRSWDKSDRREYLSLETYRGVQPMQLEDYFAALGSNDPRRKVVELLSSEDTLVIQRVLTYSAGGTLPWPYGPDSLESLIGIKRLREPMREQAAQVERLLQRKQPEVRRLAAAVYADFAGDKGISRTQALLEDPDEVVRAIAVGVLARHDAADAEAIARAVRGHQEPHVACKLIEALRKWGKLQAVPALIEFLQNDGFSYQYGDDLGVPALKAQAALKEITGYDFPTSVEASRRAWEKANTITDPKERIATLATEIPCDPQPLACEIVWDREQPKVTLTNRSRHALVLAKEPTGSECRTGNRLCDTRGLRRPATKDDFTELASGTSLQVKLDPSLAVAPGCERLTLYFLANGNEVGVNAWIGVVVMDSDPATRPAGAESQPS